MGATINLALSSSTFRTYPLLSHYSSVSPHFINLHAGFFPKGVKLRKRECWQIVKADNEGKEFKSSPSWDENPNTPYEKLPGGEKVYLDEHDVFVSLDSFKDLKPLDPSHNPAAYLWNKISDIPEERRHRLLHLLKPRLVRAAWEAAGTRYDDPDIAGQSSSSLLSGETDANTVEFWKCRKSGGAMPFAIVKTLKKALFRKDGQVYGRLIGESLLGRATMSFKPLYFSVKEVEQVQPTKEPCDLAYDFGDGLLDHDDYPKGFPKPAKHAWPFNDGAVIYVRHVGPGVMIGQLWQEGVALDQVPGKICNEILMVKLYSSSAS